MSLLSVITFLSHKFTVGYSRHYIYTDADYESLSTVVIPR